jgi:hypothetical protein
MAFLLYLIFKFWCPAHHAVHLNSSARLLIIVHCYSIIIDEIGQCELHVYTSLDILLYVQKVDTY